MSCPLPLPAALSPQLYSLHFCAFVRLFCAFMVAAVMPVPNAPVLVLLVLLAFYLYAASRAVF
jgi:hypothetical protein